MSGKLLPEPKVGSWERNVALLRIIFLVITVCYLGMVILLGQRSWFGSLRMVWWISAALLFFPLILIMIFTGKKR